MHTEEPNSRQLVTRVRFERGTSRMRVDLQTVTSTTTRWVLLLCKRSLLALNGCGSHLVLGLSHSTKQYNEPGVSCNSREYLFDPILSQFNRIENVK
jgi:hypothetical protein